MFCWCSMPLSIVRKASNSCCAKASNSPFAFWAHPQQCDEPLGHHLVMQ
jgi:hypothetical protein